MKFICVQAIAFNYSPLSEIFFQSSKKMVRVDIDSLSVSPIIIERRYHLGKEKVRARMHDDMTDGQSMADFAGTKVLFNASAQELCQMLKRYNVSPQNVEKELASKIVDASNIERLLEQTGAISYTVKR